MKKITEMSGEQLHLTLTALKVIALRKYAGMQTADETDKIQEFEFAVRADTGKICQFEYWTNTKRTKGYRIFNMEEIDLSFTSLCEMLNSDFPTLN